jgi:type I restriction enzyme M protein
MIADHLTGIEQFGADLWKMADDLRANSGLALNKYFMPIMGLLFLRRATNRYYAALAAIEADKAAGKDAGSSTGRRRFSPPPCNAAA